MEIRKSTLETCHLAEDVVVVIDVLRAFTTSAHAFDRGAAEILLVSTLEQAFDIRAREPQYLLVGEVDALPIPEFDLSNSPAVIAGLDLTGRRLVMRTTAGTQGVVRATRADHVFVASLCVAGATAAQVAALDPKSVTFVETGVGADGGGEEDTACADYIASLLQNAPLDLNEIQARVISSSAAVKFASSDQPDFPAADLEFALQADRFDFAMKVERRNERNLLRRVNGP